MSPAKLKERRQRLIPGGVPRYIRVYDNGGGASYFCGYCLVFSDHHSCGHRVIPATGGTADRYTVVFTGNYPGRQGCDYIGMNEHPFHPMGIGQHLSDQRIIDAPNGFPPKVGGVCPWGGRRITFAQLPKDSKNLVLQTYRDLWNLNDPTPKDNGA